MAPQSTSDHSTPLSFENDWEDYHSHAWKISELVVQRRLAAFVKPLHDLRRELNNTAGFLKKVFVDKPGEFPTMDSSIQTMVTVFIAEFESLKQEGRLITEAPASEPSLVNNSTPSEAPRLNKRSLENDDHSTCSKRHKSQTSEHLPHGSPDIADLARGQWQAQRISDRQRSTSSTYIMPDIIQKIPRSEVEFRHFVFQYPAFGNGYFIIQCHWGPCTQSKFFIRHPFETSQALEHFNNPRHVHGKQTFSELEIMKTFALQVQDATDDWVTASNLIVSRPIEPSKENQTGNAKKPKARQTAAKSSTKALTRKQPVSIANAEPLDSMNYGTNYYTAPMATMLPISQDPDYPNAQLEIQEEPSLDSIRVQVQ